MFHATISAQEKQHILDGDYVVLEHFRNLAIYLTPPATSGSVLGCE
jgi:hypothetical protein